MRDKIHYRYRLCCKPLVWGQNLCDAQLRKCAIIAGLLNQSGNAWQFLWGHEKGRRWADLRGGTPLVSSCNRVIDPYFVTFSSSLHITIRNPIPNPNSNPTVTTDPQIGPRDPQNVTVHFVACRFSASRDLLLYHTVSVVHWENCYCARVANVQLETRHKQQRLWADWILLPYYPQRVASIGPAVSMRAQLARWLTVGTWQLQQHCCGIIKHIAATYWTRQTDGRFDANSWVKKAWWTLGIHLRGSYLFIHVFVVFIGYLPARKPMLFTHAVTLSIDCVSVVVHTVFMRLPRYRLTVACWRSFRS